MIINTYELVIESGGTVSTSYEMQAEEYLAAFHMDKDAQGDLTLQAKVRPSEMFRDVYQYGSVVSFSSVTSGQLHVLDNTKFLQSVRFSAASSQDDVKTIILTTVEL